MTTAAYEIGSEVWFKGDAYEVTTAPYVLHGAEWQDAKSSETGKTVTIPTPAATAATVERNRNEWADMQDGFRRLNAAR